MRNQGTQEGVDETGGAASRLNSSKVSCEAIFTACRFPSPRNGRFLSPQQNLRVKHRNISELVARFFEEAQVTGQRSYLRADERKAQKEFECWQQCREAAAR